jgi:hypothetical protein
VVEAKVKVEVEDKVEVEAKAKAEFFSILTLTSAFILKAVT